MGVKQELQNMYVDYCRELSAYTNPPIEKEEALSIFNRYWDNSIAKGEVNISLIYDNLRELAGFMIIWNHAIEQLYIRPESRGKGLAKELLVKNLRFSNTYELAVLKDNPALSFWEHITADRPVSLTRINGKVNTKYPEEQYYYFVI